MPRPYRKRIVRYSGELFYKPQGIRMAGLEKVIVGPDECEALRLADYEGMSHEEAGKQMGVSRQTFGRIIESARKKVADAIINAKAFSITKEGPIEMKFARYNCASCGYEWKGAMEGRVICPSCSELATKRRGRHGRGPEGKKRWRRF